jgi:TolA-binding protein
MKKTSFQMCALFLLVAGIAALVGGQGARPLSAKQTGGLPALEKRVADLEKTVNSLQQTNTSQTAEIAALTQRLDQVEGKLAFVPIGGRRPADARRAAGSAS